MSHWPRQNVDTTNRVWVVVGYNPGEGVRNDSDRPLTVYMDLEVNHSRRFLADNQVARTLPGINNFTTDRDRSLILQTQAVSITIEPGQVLGPTAIIVLDRRAFPDQVAYDIRSRVRLVENSNVARAEDVGRVVLQGEHIQNDIFTVGYL